MCSSVLFSKKFAYIVLGKPWTLSSFSYTKTTRLPHHHGKMRLRLYIGALYHCLMVYCSHLSNIVSAWWVDIKWTVMNNNYKEWITELNWKNKGLSGCLKGVSENAKISVMLKKTLFCGYDRSYAVLPRVQCKEYNLQFMLLSIYFPHAIKSVWCTVIFSSHNTLVFRRFAISDYMVTTAAYDEIRNESDHGGDPTGLFSNITVHNLLVWIHHNSTLHTFFPDEHNTKTGIDIAHGGQGILTWHRLYLLFFDRSLQKMTHDKSFAVPYWKWTENKETCTICTEKHLGATNVTTGRVTGKYFTSWSVICTEEQTRGLTRMCNSSDEKSSLESLNSKDKKGLEARGFATTFPTLEDVNFALKFETFDLPPHSAETSCSFRNILEGFAGLDIDCQTFTPFITKFIYIWEVTWVMFRQQLMTPSSTFITRSSIWSLRNGFKLISRMLLSFHPTMPHLATTKAV